MLFLALKSEYWRLINLYRSYRISAISTPITYVISFILVTIIFQNIADMQGVVYDKQAQYSSLLGVLTWYVCIGSMGALPRMIHQEALEGTLESVLISSRSLSTLVLSRLIITVIERFLIAILMAAALLISLQIQPQLNIATTLIFTLTLLGAIGIGLFFAGLGLIYKSIGQLIGLVVNLAVFISGALVPIDSLTLLFNILKPLFPTVWGIHLMRQSLFATSLTTPWLGLSLQTLCFCLLGIASFRYGFQRAQQYGSLGDY